MSDVLFSVRRELTEVMRSELTRTEVLALLAQAHPARDYESLSDDRLAEEFEAAIGNDEVITDHIYNSEWTEDSRQYKAPEVTVNR